MLCLGALSTIAGGWMVPTLDEVSRIAGVSRSTVSRVINNHPNVSKATRTRVQQTRISTHSVAVHVIGRSARHV